MSTAILNIESPNVLETLLAEREIAQQLNNYCRAMDRNDGALGNIVFHPDSELDYGAMFKGSGAEFIAFILKAHPHMETHVHRIFNVSITIDGNRAGSESYIDGRFRSTDGSGNRIERNTCGRFIDQWERHDGRWVIRKRSYLHSTDSARPVEAPMSGPGGARDTSDPSYAVLSLTS